MANREIAEAMGVSISWVKKLWARYRSTGPSRMTCMCRMGRPVKSLPRRREHSAVLQTSTSRPGGSSFIHDFLCGYGINISQRGIRRILLEVGSSERRPGKSG